MTVNNRNLNDVLTIESFRVAPGRTKDLPVDEVGRMLSGLTLQLHHFLLCDSNVSVLLGLSFLI
jgi:hypothetical protein